MADPVKSMQVPRGALIGAGALMTMTFALALLGRVTGFGVFVTPPGRALHIEQLRFEDRADGAVLVLSAADDRVVDVVQPNTGHFVRGTVRGLVRERKREGIGTEPPFLLSRLEDGRLRLEDPSTRKRIDLDAFGRSNALAFSAIMEAAQRSKRGG